MLLTIIIFTLVVVFFGAMGEIMEDKERDE